ncbi:MAG: hypothetical protein IT381_29205 [Deltaproteobacteria bacterium]|nr:hypothetical protein [Deltaproteobacteria bacterium]
MSGTTSDWATKTFVGNVSVETGWRVYRVRTQNSSYSVGLRVAGKRVGALRGHSQSGGAINVRDSDATVGGVSVFDVEPDHWLGRVLDFAGITTSPVLEVSKETDANVITEMTSPGVRALAPRQAEQPRPRPEYPVSVMEYAEHAHALLGHVARDQQAIRLLVGKEAWATRLKLALSGAVTMANAIADETREQ